MREEEHDMTYRRAQDERDTALTRNEFRSFKILVIAVVGTALICCGAGIGLGVALA